MRNFLLSLALVLGYATALPAADLPAATGTPLLTITIGDETIVLDDAGLRSLPVSGFTTTTIWTDGPQDFAGVRVTDLLARLGVSTGTMSLTAANDYRIEIAVEDFTDDGALIAYDRNGAAMSLRDKGPLWLVYPYDADAKFRNELIYTNSIWQLDRIQVTE